MSAQENTAFMYEVYKLFGEGNVPAILERCAEDIKMQIALGAAEGTVPYAGTFRGRDGMIKFFTTLAESVETQQLEPREFISEGDKVVVIGQQKIKVKTTGKTYETDWVQVWTVRDDKIEAMHMFADTAAALGAWQGAQC